MQNKNYDEFTFVSSHAGNARAVTQPPKKAYDMEYSTQAKREVEFLSQHGIHPTFIRKSEYGVKTYKYTKTPALFKLLVEYYSMVQAEKEWDKLERTVDDNGRSITKEDEELIDALIARGAPIKKVRIYA